MNQHLSANLPQDPRTLLRPPAHVDITTLMGGPPEANSTLIADDDELKKTQNKEQYWHYGMKKCLRAAFPYLAEDHSITININVDGLPLHKSTYASFWPILINVYEFPDISPMTVGIFHGDSKPHDAAQFLEHFVSDLNQILNNGILINGKKLTVSIRSFICDTPARSFIKGTCAFNAYHGCQKCTVVGEYSQKWSKMIFPKMKDFPPRQGLSGLCIRSI